MSEDQILRELSADNVRGHVEHIIYRIPSHLAGSKNGRRMAGYSRDSLRGVGVDAVMHELPGLVSFPHEAPAVALGGIEERRHLDPGPADVAGDFFASMAVPRFECGEIRRHVAEGVGLVLDAGDEDPSRHELLPSDHRPPRPADRSRPEQAGW